MGTPAEEKFLKEKQEYEDAVQAYRSVLGGIFSDLPDPLSMQTWYAPENQGYERAATDPWIIERFPDLARAGEKVTAEESDYLALDDPFAYHANSQCSISSFVGDKFYEYVAMLEVVYLLAKDADFRREVLERFSHSTIGNYFASVGLYQAAKWNMILHPFSDANKNMETIEQANALSQQALSQIGDYFQSVWDEIRKNYHECGLGNTIVKAGVDGAFLVGEIAVGAAALKALKLVAQIVRVSGAPAVRISVQGFASSRLAAKAEIADIVQSVEGKTFSFEALEAKYGKPGDNHVGGELPDTNRELPDKSAEEMLEERLDSPAFRHPRDGARPRSREELLPDGKVPFDKHDATVFQSWWDDLSPEELTKLTSDPALLSKINNRIRSGGEAHEWLKVSQQLEHKRLGFSMKEVQEWVTATKDAQGPLPTPTAKGDVRWRHAPEGGGRGSGTGSKAMHNALDALYTPPAQNRNELLRRMGYWANSYMDGGVDGLPAGLRDALISAGGG